jgi:arsenate reductase (thioredoxin)
MRRFQLFAAAMIAVVCVATGYSVAQISTAPDGKATVLFVCQHGNVKSLMAASYFNQQAAKLGLPYRAVARGVAPDSTTVPEPVAEGLRADGVDVSGFQPAAVKASDTATSAHVVTIGATLPEDAQRAAGTRIEQWNDVPPASDGFAGTRDSIKQHVRMLIEKLDKH